MLGPIRRSVSQPLLRSLGRRACIRQIHARDVVRGPVAAEARVESELFVTDFSIQQTPKNSASKRKLPSVPTQVPQQSKPSPQQKQKNSPQKKKETKKPIQKTERIEVEEPEISDEVKRSTSSSIDSPVNWKKETIFKLYEPPTTEQLPDTLHSKTSIPQSLISWRENPLQYLREGLRFTLNFSAVLLKSKTIRGGNNSKAKQSAQMHRVKLMVKWGRQVSVAIGDGTTKVYITFMSLSSGSSGTKRSVAFSPPRLCLSDIAICLNIRSLQKFSSRDREYEQIRQSRCLRLRSPVRRRAHLQKHCNPGNERRKTLPLLSYHRRRDRYRG